MRSVLVPSLALLVASIGALAIAGDIESGVPVGKGVAAFNVKDITGPNAGKSLCYR